MKYVCPPELPICDGFVKNGPKGTCKVDRLAGIKSDMKELLNKVATSSDISALSAKIDSLPKGSDITALVEAEIDDKMSSLSTGNAQPPAKPSKCPAFYTDSPAYGGSGPYMPNTKVCSRASENGKDTNGFEC